MAKQSNMKRQMTIYEALANKLNRVPTNAELKEEVRRIKQEGFILAATAGKLPFQRKR